MNKIGVIGSGAFIVCGLGAFGAQAEPAAPQESAPTESEAGRVSPSLGINHPPRRGARPPRPPAAPELRSYDGSLNNLVDPEMGATYSALARWLPTYYADGVSALAGADRPSPRAISNAVSAQLADTVNARGASDYLWQWGQFVDHDLDLTDGADPAEPAPIAVPLGDPWFDPYSTGTVTIAFNRSIWDPATGSDPGNPRQQVNEISAWIDASNVYGSDDARVAALRTLDGTGRLKTSAGDLLPFNADGLPNAGGSGNTLFLAGDVRANEQVGLTALHTLFVREHNRLAARLAAMHPDWDGERIFQKARALVGAEVQMITYDEYLPALLGRDAVAPYRGYRASVDAGISNLFSAASYRYGHSALSPTLLRLDADGNEIAQGHLALRDAFFNPSRITDEGGIEPLLRGLAAQRCQAIDPYVVDDVRNFLFGPPGAGGFDLASLNIQRGRDHGLPGYNDAREFLGLRRAETFADISRDADIQARLALVYADPDQIDLWVGALAEDPRPGSHLGEVNHIVVRRQFDRLRNGDRFWYETALSSRDLDLIRGTTLARVIRRNTTIGDELPDDVFRVATGGRPDNSGPRPDPRDRPGQAGPQATPRQHVGIDDPRGR